MSRWCVPICIAVACAVAGVLFAIGAPFGGSLAMGVAVGAAYIAGGMQYRALVASATSALQAAALVLDADIQPTAVLIPDETTGPFTGHVYRIVPVGAQVEGHPRGLVVFLDDAKQILDAAQTDAYADAFADQAAEIEDDPEQDDAFAEQDALYDLTVKPVLSAETRARLDDPDRPRLTVNDTDLLPIDAGPRCDSGITASFCTRCGTCTCPQPNDGGWPFDLDDPSCPLHGTDSDHATTPGLGE